MTRSDERCMYMVLMKEKKNKILDTEARLVTINLSFFENNKEKYSFSHTEKDGGNDKQCVEKRAKKKRYRTSFNEKNVDDLRIRLVRIVLNCIVENKQNSFE